MLCYVCMHVMYVRCTMLRYVMYIFVLCVNVTSRMCARDVMGVCNVIYEWRVLVYFMYVCTRGYVTLGVYQCACLFACVLRMCCLQIRYVFKLCVCML